MNLPNRIKPFLITLSLCCAAPLLQPLSAAEAEPAAAPVAWQVPDADVRVPVSISSENAMRALGRTPPDVYLSELKPLKFNGLTFMPKTTNSPKEKNMEGQWNPALNGTATYALKPEYAYFTCWVASYENRSFMPLTASFDGGKTFVRPKYRGAWGTDANSRVVHLFDRRESERAKGSAVIFPIPPGSKTITLKYSNKRRNGGDLHIWVWYKQEPLVQAGFLTRRPSVASVDFELPSLDLARFVPLVYTASGKRVGCRALWAKLGDPMVLQFDCSSGETQYYVYLVERSKNPPAMAWQPKAGVVMESRLVTKYDPSVATLAGFRKLWAESDEVLGRNEVFSIYGFWFPFRPTIGPVLRYKTNPGKHDLNKVSGRKHLALTTFTGTFHVPYTGQYEFLYSAEEAAFFLIDGKLVSQMNYNEGRELWDGGQGRRGVRVSDRWINVNAHRNNVGYKHCSVDLTKGAHQLEFLVYGATQRFRAAVNMRWPGKNKFQPMGVHWNHGGFCAWEPIVTAQAGTTERRGQKLSASFSYKRTHDTRHRWHEAKNAAPYLADYPGLDAYNMFFTAHLSQKTEGAIYRWQFSDGSVRQGGPELRYPFRSNPDRTPWNQIKGKVVFHTFLSAGLKTVHLEVLDGPDGKVIARASGKVRVEARWEYPISGHGHGRDGGEPLPRLLAREPEFRESMPIAELVSLYHRSSLEQNSRWAQLNDAVVDAMAHRVDELIETFPYSRLLDWGADLASPARARYDIAERLLKAVMQRAPAGGYHWNAAVTQLAKFDAHARPEQAIKMLKLLKETDSIADMSEGWKLAPAKEWVFLPPMGMPLPADQLKGLKWSEFTFPLSRDVHGAAGLWLSKEFTLPVSRKGKELVIEFGSWLGNQNIHPRAMWSGAIWCNGKWVGRPMEAWPDGRVVIPANVQNSGGKNRLSLLFQSSKLPRFFDQGVSSFGVISPDIKRLAWTDRHNHRIYLRRTGKTLWDTDPGQLAGHESRIRSLAFAPDNRRLASGSHDKTIKLWDTDTGKELRTLRGHTGTPRVLAFSPDGKQLASVSELGTVIRVWSTGNGAQVRMIKGHTGGVRSLAWSPDGTLLASGSKDETIKLWDSASGALRTTLKTPSSPVVDLTFAPDSRRLASASGPGNQRSVIVWDLDSAKELCKVRTGIHSPHVPLAFTPAGASLAIPGQLVDSATGKVLLQLQPPTPSTPITAEGDVSEVVQQGDTFMAEAVFSPDGKQLAAWGATAVTLWDAKTGKPLRQLKVDGRGWKRPVWRQDGQWAEDFGAYWRRGFQLRGPQKVNKENMHVPMPLYLTKACKELGVNVAYYEGPEDGKLPDFVKNKIEPTASGAQRKTDLSMRKRDENFGMTFTGFMKVDVEAEYSISWHADAHTTLTIDGKAVGNRAKVFLTAGPHPVGVTYRQQGKGSTPRLTLTLPYTVVTGSEVVATRIKADALLALGRRAEAVKILTELNPFAWPLPPEEQEYVEQARMRIRRFSRASRHQGQYALPIIDSWLFSHPMLRLDPGFMVSVIEAYANMGDRDRAFLLAEQMLKEEMNDGQRRILILTQVKAKLNDGDLPAAGKVYQKLKKLAPQSEETIEARELMRAAVIERKK